MTESAVPSRSTGSPTLAVSIRHLTVIRGRNKVLNDFNLDLPAGQVIGLLGPSGCGKTTLMRSIVGVQRVASGEVSVLGESAGSADLRRRVGYVTQSASVYDELSVRQNVEYFRRVLGAPKSDVARVIGQVGLSDLSDRRVASLSGGERSRVSLAVALVGDPALLVLDEPTVGLDPVLRQELWGIFAELASHGVTLLVSSHVMDEASRCDRLVLMREGEVLSNSSVPELLAATEALNIEQAFLTLINRRAA